MHNTKDKLFYLTREVVEYVINISSVIAASDFNDGSIGDDPWNDLGTF